MISNENLFQVETLDDKKDVCEDVEVKEEPFDLVINSSAQNESIFLTSPEPSEILPPDFPYKENFREDMEVKAESFDPLLDSPAQNESIFLTSPEPIGAEPSEILPLDFPYKEEEVIVDMGIKEEIFDPLPPSSAKNLCRFLTTPEPAAVSSEIMPDDFSHKKGAVSFLLAMDKSGIAARPSITTAKRKLSSGDICATLAEICDTDSESDIYIQEYDPSSCSSSDSENIKPHSDSESSVGINWKPGKNFKPYEYSFDNSRSGIKPKFKLDINSNAYDYFRLLVTDELIDLIVYETNKYSHYLLQKPFLPQKSKLHRWKCVDHDDILTFLSLTMLMAHVKKHRLCDFWSSDTLIETGTFKKYMSLEKYQVILQCLHFSNETQSCDGNDRLWKIRPALDILQKAFQNGFYPHQKLVIGESLILFKGRLVFKQYIPSKRYCFGMKLFVLCDCETGMILDFIINTETDMGIDSSDPLGVSGAIVEKLLYPYLDRGHILYTDKWLTSPMLSLYLHEKNTGSCGTAKKNKKFMPKFTGKEKLELMESKPLLAVKYTDKREVYFITTLHRGEWSDTRKKNKTNQAIKLPDAIIDHSKNMSLVDKIEMPIGTIECLRRSLKWYRKLFFHIIDMCIVNAHHLYLLNTQKTITMREFSLNICRKMLEKHGTVTKLIPGRFSDNAPDRLICANYISRHHLVPIGKKGTILIQRRCHVCYNSVRNAKRSKKVTTWCPECHVPLCFECFMVYHTVKDY